jgi:hexosaminidase
MSVARASSCAGLCALGLLTADAQAQTVATPPAAVAVAPDANVIPAPANVAPRAGRFTLTGGTQVLVPQGREAARVAVYFADLLRTSHGMRLRVMPFTAAGSRAPGIVFRLDPQAPAAAQSYQLEVSPGGVLVSARDSRGLFYGAVTLWQLCSAQLMQRGAITLEAMLITDAPRFAWRGLMLDSARHFQSPEFIRHYIDWMALHKLNMLGWHLTDDQGWRLEIKKYPRLTSVGAWRVPAGRAAQRDIDARTGRPRLYGGFYTQEDVRRIVAYAAARNVTIVPEVDLPAHTTAALVAYPALAAEPARLPAAVPADWGIYTHVCNIDEATFGFIDDVLDEVIALFPGVYIHVGGDEVVTDEWRDSPRVRARMRELNISDAGAVQGYFEQRLGRYLAARGRRLVGWDEIVQAGLGPDATVMSWRGVAGAVSAARAGHDAVLAPDPVLYLDHRQGTSPGEPPGRASVESLQDVYGFNPVPTPLAADREHLLGVQANLWTEHVRTEERAAYMTWPRAAALAELAWSPPERIGWDNFLQRLPAEFERYRMLGVPFSADVFAPPRNPGLFDRHMSQDLRSCSNKLGLNLEDDAPVNGKRAVFLIDIMNPCWILPAADLSQASGLTVAIGQVPFNFQIGKDVESIHLNRAHSAAGELEVRVDQCEGAPLVVLPLAPAVDNDAVTVLPAVLLPHLAGKHELCFKFAQHGIDPMWAIDWVQLSQ